MQESSNGRAPHKVEAMRRDLPLTSELLLCQRSTAREVGFGPLRLATLALAIALAGCATKPSPAPASRSAASKAAASKSPAPPAAPSSDASSESPRAASPATPKGKAAQAKSKGKGSASAKAAPAERAERPPAVVAKAEKKFLRPAGGAVIAKYDGRGNKGLDFAGSKGDPVYASREGRVVYAASGLRGYGQLVMIKHDANYVTAYAHNSQLLVKEGQAVKKGQVIARMGSTDTNRVKLHFELRRKGSAVDPAAYFESGEAAEPAKSAGPH